MKTTKKTNSNANVNANVNALDSMEKEIANAERLAKIEQNKAKRLEKATERLETLKQGAPETMKGFANVTLKITHQHRAINASVQGAIDALNSFIKEVAKASIASKEIIAALKGEAARTLLQQVTEKSLPLYIDSKGNYKVETLYRIVASKAKNAELRQILTNLKKQSK